MNDLSITTASRIVNYLAPDATVRSVRALTGGVSATIHALDLGDHGTVVVRQHDRAAIEAGLLRVLTAEGIPVPKVRLLDASGTVLLAPYYVMDFVPGTPFVDIPGDGVSIASQMADALVAIHRVDTRTLDGIPVGNLDDELDGLLNAGIDDMQAGRIRGVLRGANVAEDDAVCVLHGDYWPGNILVDHGQLVSIIDWEDAVLGSPLWDVANARLELLWSHGQAAMEMFTARYAEVTARSTGDLERSVAVWDLRVALRPIGKIETWGLPEEKVAEMRSRHEAFVNAACARLGG